MSQQLHRVPPAPIERPRDELVRLIHSRFPLVYLDSPEEARAEATVLAAAVSSNRRAWTWSISSGLVAAGASHDEDAATREPQAALRRILEQPGDDVFILRDAATHVEQDAVANRLLRDAARSTRATLVLLGAGHTVAAELTTHAAVYALPRPDTVLIATHVNQALDHAARAYGTRVLLDHARRAKLVESLRGLTLEQVDQVLSHLLHDDDQLDDADIDRALQEKGRLLAQGGVLSLETTSHGLDWVAGFQHLRTWVSDRHAAFGDAARDFGIPAPRGLLLTGVPGCGKSFVAKAIAHTWSLPLLRLDAGSLYNSFIGHSERNLREALATAEALAPSVLWIDEIEKGFGSTGPSSSDGGLSYRMLGTLATWMQERTAPVFLIATSNDITKLPPELTRQGRFDETFFVDLPDAAAREHLFSLQLARRGRDYTRFDCAVLAAASEGFSGAEVEQSITNALYAAFAAKREVLTGDIARELAATRPLSEVNPMAIDAIRSWGRTHARPV